MKKILLLNTGGTFSKIYNPLTGNLDVPRNNYIIKHIIKECFKNNLNIDIKGMIYKDSLDITGEDRQSIVESIQKYDNIVIIHGTDTVNISAAFVAEACKDKQIVFTGAMIPFHISPVEATSNLAQAIQYIMHNEHNGVYICMHGITAHHTKIQKDRTIGEFKPVF